jgi:hypothetical protein
LSLAVVAATLAFVFSTPTAGRVSYVHAGLYTDAFTFTNDTGQAAGFLHVQSNETFGALPSVNAPGCPAPTVFESGFEYWEIVWPSPCVDPGESVSFEMSAFTVIYGSYFAPSVPIVSAVQPGNPPSNGLRIEVPAFVKGAAVVQNAPGCLPPAVSSGSAAVELTWSSACVDPGEKITLHIGAPGPVTTASFVWSPSTVVGGVAFDPTAGWSTSTASLRAATLAATLLAAMLVTATVAAVAFRRRVR